MGRIYLSVPRCPATHFPGKIGRYKLLEQIGEGGCGVVYVAAQTEPVRRRVALKVIKMGMDTKAVVARFEAERQALAMMDHPNIAKVLDAGATESSHGVPPSGGPYRLKPGLQAIPQGLPYFVMELGRGIKPSKILVTLLTLPVGKGWREISPRTFALCAREPALAPAVPEGFEHSLGNPVRGDGKCQPSRHELGPRTHVDT